MDLIQLLTRNTDNTYIYRAYEEYNTLRYRFAMPVSFRGRGEWEAHAWNSVKLLWPEASLMLFPVAMKFIMDRLSDIEPRFEKLTGTFELDRLKAYQRMFRKYFILEPLRQVDLSYNGCNTPAMEVWFKVKEDK